jgi:hypothetical protein
LYSLSHEPGLLDPAKTPAVVPKVTLVLLQADKLQRDEFNINVSRVVNQGREILDAYEAFPFKTSCRRMMETSDGVN